MKEFAKLKIAFTAVKVNEKSNKMIKVMEDCYEKEGLKLFVTDLAKACATKSQAEITKDFVKAASYILSVAVGGGAAQLKKEPVGDPLWDIKKLEKG